MNPNLRDFLRAVRETGPDNYVEVTKPLDSYLEISIIQHKLAAEGRNPVIYCPEIKGSSLPLVTNMFGSFDLLAWGLGCDPRSMSRVEIYDVLRRKLAQREDPVWVAEGDAPVKEKKLVGDDVDLSLLPIIHNSKLDAGKYISAGFMIAKWPDTGVPNAGIYRHMVMGRNRLGCMINPGNDGAYIARRCAELGRPMEIALVIGHHSAVLQASQGKGVVEFDLMGGYLGESLEVVKGETVDLPVPAQAEIVIEGTIDPAAMSTDGPYAEYLGYYGVGDKPCYVIDVSAITMRGDAIYHHLDSAHIEHNLAPAMSAEMSMYDRLRAQFPDPQGGERHGLAGHVRVVAAAGPRRGQAGRPGGRGHRQLRQDRGGGGRRRGHLQRTGGDLGHPHPHGRGPGPADHAGGQGGAPRSGVLQRSSHRPGPHDHPPGDRCHQAGGEGVREEDRAGPGAVAEDRSERVSETLTRH